MKRLLLCSSLLFGAVGAAQAAERTLVLHVPGMDCAACPYVVARSLKSVQGVIAVETSLKAKTASVVYDDAVTSPKALTRATRNAGYPSTPADGARK